MEDEEMEDGIQSVDTISRWFTIFISLVFYRPLVFLFFSNADAVDMNA
jgi:hypothetical protein